MKTALFGLFCVSFLCLGCETARRGAQKVGEPIGGTFKTLGGVTEGAVDGYAVEESVNPYNR
jgi:hypothetical protein